MSPPADTPQAAFPMSGDEPARARPAEQPIDVGEGQHGDGQQGEGQHGDGQQGVGKHGDGQQGRQGRQGEGKHGERQHSEDGSVEGEHGKAPSVDGPPSTGDVAVDEALSELPDLSHQPLEAQVDGYTAVHGRLQDRLADLDG